MTSDPGIDLTTSRTPGARRPSSRRAHTIGRRIGLCLLAAWLPLACKTTEPAADSSTTDTTVARRSTRTKVRRAPRYERTEEPSTEVAEKAAQAGTDAATGEKTPAEESPSETRPQETGPPPSQEPPPTAPPQATLPEDDFVREMNRIRDEHLGRAEGMNQDLSELFTLADEEELGSGAAAVIAAEGLVQKPEALLEYLAMIAATLGAVSDRPEVRYRVGLIDSDEANAFSLPGGFLFITRGAVLAARDEAELAGMLAHEVAHVALRHGIREIDAAKYRILMNSAVLDMKSELQKHGMGGETTELEQELSEIADEFYEYTRHPHSQAMEKEADRAAVFYMARAGWDPRGLPEMLARLEKDGADPALRAMSSHPPVGERIASLRGPLREVPAGGARMRSRFEKNTAALRTR